mgnify:CR=1 FL=1
MLRHRVIPVLLHDTDGLVKTRQFREPVYVGDPINAVRIFNEKQVDELVLLEISRSRLGLGPDFALVERVASECFMPLAYGGGVRDPEDARALFTRGVEKVVVQTAALKDLDTVRKIADRTGSQSVAVSVDLLLAGPSHYKLWRSSVGRVSDVDWRAWLRAIQAAGAGEVLLTSVAREGSMSGFDLELIRTAAAELTVPLVAQGGAGSIKDLAEAVGAGADAVAAGSLFVFHRSRTGVLLSYPEYSQLEERLGSQDG